MDNHEPTNQPTAQSEYKGWEKKIILFIIGQTISLFGSSLVQYAIIWHITLTTASGSMMTLATLFGFLPQVAISLFAGVWADRYSRKMLIMVADGLIATFTLALAFIFMTGYKEIWVLLIISGIRSFGAGIQSPAVSAFIPQIVPKDDLMKVTGINSSITSITALIAPAVGGLILSISSIEIVFFMDVFTAIIGISILFTIKVAPHPRENHTAPIDYIHELKGGIKYVLTAEWVKEILVLYILFMLLLTPAAFLTPLLITRSFGDNVWRLTVNQVLFGGGAVIGGLTIAAWGGFKNRMFTIATAAILFGLFTASLGIAANYWIYVGIVFILGILMPFVGTPSTVLLQQKVPAEFHGRVFGLIGIVSAVAMPAGMLIFGPLSDLFPVQHLMMGTGLATAILGVIMFSNKRLRELAE